MEEALWADFDCNGVASKMYLNTITLQKTHARGLLLSLFNHCWCRIAGSDEVRAYIPIIISALTLFSHTWTHSSRVCWLKYLTHVLVAICKDITLTLCVHIQYECIFEKRGGKDGSVIWNVWAKGTCLNVNVMLYNLLKLALSCISISWQQYVWAQSHLLLKYLSELIRLLTFFSPSSKKFVTFK